MLSKPIHAKPSLYSFYFDIIKEIGIKYGYNIVLHGSLNRDLDLIAIPWLEELGDKDLMIDEITDLIGGEILLHKTIEDPVGKRFSVKPHNRITYIININRRIEFKFNGFSYNIKEYADPQYYIDISVII